VRAALLNRFTQLGRPTTVPVVAMVRLRLGLGSSRSAFDLCNKANRLQKETTTLFGGYPDWVEPDLIVADVVVCPPIWHSVAGNTSPIPPRLTNEQLMFGGLGRAQLGATGTFISKSNEVIDG
jgi:hypothetical protein